MKGVSVEVIEADLGDREHTSAIVDLIDAYSQDPLADGAPLAADVRDRLASGLRDHPTTLVFLAYDGARPIGVAVCFFGYSTFAAAPLINIHDLYVVPDARGRGVSRALLDAVSDRAITDGCCKLTLEVLESNVRARFVYEAAGFAQATYLPEAGGALFMAKPLAPPDKRFDRTMQGTLT
ncbi:MAG: GNAT family N-acetyltransferase [Clostridiales bacterium]|nr:GNAT family N-acetyltransferase [Clostridiales bacterium]